MTKKPEQMTKLEIFMLDELLLKASHFVEINMSWFEELLDKTESITKDDKEYYAGKDGSDL